MSTTTSGSDPASLVAANVRRAMRRRGYSGVQMAKALANQGCNIACMARRQEKIDETAKMLADEYGVETLAVRCDVTDTDMVESAVKQVVDKWPGSAGASCGQLGAAKLSRSCPQGSRGLIH